MTDETPTTPIDVDGQGIRIVLSPETEAHRRHLRDVSETVAHRRHLRDVSETEAHRRHLRDAPETEAHGFSMSPADPALDAYARIRLSFPADAPEQSLELRYRPAASPGEQPEVEVHRRHLR